MTQRTTLASALTMSLAIATGTAALLAAERATLILSNGERISGTLNASYPDRFSDEADQLSLRLTAGTDVPVQVRQIAVVDFVGGQPRRDELDALPPSGQALALRDGAMRRGRFIGILAGDTIRWEQALGGRTDVPIRQVRRIYLDPVRALELYDETAPWPGSGQTSATRPSVIDPREARRGGQTGGAARQGQAAPPRTGTFSAAEAPSVVVRGNVPWTDTGFTVRAGESIRLDPSGRVFFSLADSDVAPPDGNGEVRNRDFPVPELPVGALIGKIGANGRPFAVGSAPELFRFGTSGPLYLGVNDTIFDDNSGAFRVAISRVTR